MMYRPKAERTYCTTNQECQLGGDAVASCALVGDFSLGISYGSVQCNLCPSLQLICLVTDSSGGSSGTVGVCTCLQQQTPLQSCARSDLSCESYLMRRRCVLCRCTPARPLAL